VQKWQLPPNVTALRGFLGLCNYYSGYVRMFAELAAPLQEKLKLPKELTKAESKHALQWVPKAVEAFEKLKHALVADLELHHIDTSKPFALKTDASDYAIGAALEQFPNIAGVPELKDIKQGSSVPVGFMSRKLTAGQRSRWDTRDKETYAIVSSLEKWASYIGNNPVLVLTDHKSLQSWYKEHVAGLGPTARRGRFHQKLNQFNIDVIHIPGPDNLVGETLSRWEYPAGGGYKDQTWHATAEDTEEMRAQLRRERDEERSCPKARHPMDGGGVVEVATVWSEGRPATVVRMADGRELALAVVRFKPSAAMDAVVAVTTRSQAKEEAARGKLSTSQPKKADPQQPNRRRQLHRRRTMRMTRTSKTSPWGKTEWQQDGRHQWRTNGGMARRWKRMVWRRGEWWGRMEGMAKACRRVEMKQQGTHHHHHHHCHHKQPRHHQARALHHHCRLQQMRRMTREWSNGLDWAKEYVMCPKWRTIWEETQQETPWPQGYKVMDRKLVKDGVWCVPTGLTGRVLREFHMVAGHIGGARLWREVARHYQFANVDEAWGLSQKIQGLCAVCQACEHPHQPLKIKMEPKPVPAHIMTSVCIELFQMPEV